MVVAVVALLGGAVSAQKQVPTKPKPQTAQVAKPARRVKVSSYDPHKRDPYKFEDNEWWKPSMGSSIKAGPTYTQMVNTDRIPTRDVYRGVDHSSQSHKACGGDGWYVWPCKTCDETGKLKDYNAKEKRWELVQCGVCGGDGKLQEKDPVCAGTGLWHICVICDGKGSVTRRRGPIYKETAVCPECIGSKWLPG